MASADGWTKQETEYFIYQTVVALTNPCLSDPERAALTEELDGARSWLRYRAFIEDDNYVRTAPPPVTGR